MKFEVDVHRRWSKGTAPLCAQKIVMMGGMLDAARLVIHENHGAPNHVNALTLYVANLVVQDEMLTAMVGVTLTGMAGEMLAVTLIVLTTVWRHRQSLVAKLEHWWYQQPHRLGIQVGLPTHWTQQTAIRWL